MLRALGALALLLGMLAGALWATRRFDLRLPGRVGHRPENRLDLVERLAIDQRRSAVLIRCDGREHLIIVAPEGHILVSSEAVQARKPKPKAKAVAGSIHAQSCLAAVPVAKRAAPKRTRPNPLRQTIAHTTKKSEQLA